MFSIEMTASQLVLRMISEDGSIDNEKLLNADLDSIDWTKIMKAVGNLSQMGITIVDKSRVSSNDVSTIARMRKARVGVDFIVIDFIQIMQSLDPKGKTIDVQLGETSKALKELSKELDIPVIALVQIGRDAEKRANKRPMMSDLRESGNLEQNADFVGALYRPSYYYSMGNDPDYKDAGFTEEYYEMLSEFLIIKNRHGPSSLVIKEKFWGKYSRFDVDGAEEFEEEGVF